MAEMDEENEKMSGLGDASLEDIESSKTSSINSNISSSISKPYTFNGKTNDEVINKNTIINSIKSKDLSFSTLNIEDDHQNDDDSLLDMKPPTPYSNNNNDNNDNNDKKDENILYDKKPAIHYGNIKNIEVFIFHY